MKEFNHKKAWIEVAVPAWRAVPEDMRALVAETSCCAADLRQGKDLDMPWPADGALRSAFVASPSAEVLAKTARTLFVFGHWAPALRTQLALDEAEVVDAIEAASAMQRTGVYWKFGNYVDQQLSARFGIERRHLRHPQGVSFAIHEGALRACFTAPGPDGLSCWREIGWATRDVYDRVRAVTEPDWFATNRTAPRHEEMFEDYIAQLRSAAGVDLQFEVFTKLDRYMEPHR